MTEPAPPGRPSSHRASSGARRALTRLAAPITAVAVVVAVVVLLIWINGRSEDSSTPAVATAPSAAAAPSASPSPSPSPSRSPRPTSTPTKVGPTPVPTPHQSRHHASPPASPSTAPFAPVEVLNNSRIHGLAHHVAAEVESRGWTISQVGNLHGRVAETTLFYPLGGFSAAQHLAAEFGSIQRLEPQSDGGVDSSGLVLVVTRFWSD
jgi:cytoskeletal protein RodZ